MCNQAIDLFEGCQLMLKTHSNAAGRRKSIKMGAVKITKVKLAKTSRGLADNAFFSSYSTIKRL